MATELTTRATHNPTGHAASPASPAPALRGAIYGRFSTKHQHSIEDQIRMCRQWADRNGITVKDENVFFDEAKTGKTHKRAGLKAMTAALDRVDVLICFSTNRLFRKSYMAMRFAEEEIVDRGKRCVFLVQNIDTAETKRWRALLQIQAMVDEFQLQGASDHISAAKVGLAMDRLVYSTLAFGYTGVPTGKKNGRTGRDKRTVAIDPVTSEWVKRVFYWYTKERLTMAAIVRRLNESGAPLPPVAAGRWTPAAVRYLLKNRRYIGDWSYGWHTSTWNSKKGYSIKHIREEPLQPNHVEEFRIIEDATFAEASQLIVEQSERVGGGRPLAGFACESSLHLLKGVLMCPTHGRAFVQYAQGGKMCCQACRDMTRPPLWSILHRGVAEKVVIRAVTDLLHNDDDLVRHIVSSCQEAAQTMQAQPKDDLAAPERRLATLTSSIQFILRSPGLTDTDRRENAQQLALLRSERAVLETEIKGRPADVAAPVIPTEDDIKGLFASFADILEKAATGEDRSALVRARELVIAMTGGRITLTQAGVLPVPLERSGGRPNIPHSGLAAPHWLRGTFTAELSGLVSQHFGLALADATPREITVDFKLPNARDREAEEVKALFDQGLLMGSIAKMIGCGPIRVRNLLRLWYKSRGLPVPDTQSRWASQADNYEKPRRFQLLADVAGPMWQQGGQQGAMMMQFKVDRITLIKAINYWQKRHGVPTSERIMPPPSVVKRYGLETTLFA